MKKYLFISILLINSCNLLAQLKTYSGEYRYEDNTSVIDESVWGLATYTYKESCDGERIYHGTFSFTTQDNPQYHITGNYINDKKDGIWTYSQKTEKSENLTYTKTCSMTYKNGVLDGSWKLIKYKTISNKGKLIGEAQQQEIYYTEIRNYKQGKLHGIYKKESSGLLIKASYNEGILVGKFEYKKDNEQQITGEFNNEGYPTGIWVNKDSYTTEKNFFYNRICYKSISINNNTGKIQDKQPDIVPNVQSLNDTIIKYIVQESSFPWRRIRILIDGKKYQVSTFSSPLYYNIDTDLFTPFKDCYILIGKNNKSDFDKFNDGDDYIEVTADLLEDADLLEEYEEKPYEAVEQMPNFPSGQTGLIEFIRDNLKYPVNAQENGIQGRVVLRFVVSKTGKIRDVMVLRSLDPDCDKEAIRLIKSMPTWIPGKQNDHPVPVFFILPIEFNLDQKNLQKK